MTTMYPDIEVQLSGEDGNAFFIISRVRKALRKNGVSEHDVKTFTEEASAGNYDDVIQTCMKWVAAQ